MDDNVIRIAPAPAPSPPHKCVNANAGDRCDVCFGPLDEESPGNDVNYDIDAAVRALFEEEVGKVTPAIAEGMVRQAEAQAAAAAKQFEHGAIAQPIPDQLFDQKVEIVGQTFEAHVNYQPKDLDEQRRCWLLHQLFEAGFLDINDLTAKLATLDAWLKSGSATPATGSKKPRPVPQMIST